MTDATSPKRFRDWAVESGWIVGEFPPTCAICALPEFLRAEVQEAWKRFGARETEITAYLAASGIEMPSTEPFAHHFRSPEHSK